MFGQTEYYDMTLEELIREHAELMFAYAENSFFDGYTDKLPSIEDFVNDVYDNIVNGNECEISLDGTCFDFVFPDSVRFIGTDTIKAIIRSAYNS